MKIAGLQLLKIAGEKFPNTTVTSHAPHLIEFTSFDKDKIPESKDQEAIRLGFSFKIDYEHQEGKKKDKHGLIEFEGNLIIISNKEESKKLQKDYKKKDLPAQIKAPIYNYIIAKCTPKAILLEDELNLPIHLPLPKLSIKPKEN